MARKPSKKPVRRSTQWVVRAVLFLAVTVFYQRGTARSIPLTGDEPHYLMTVFSVVRDGDFEENNNYAEEQYHEFGYPHLDPQDRAGPASVLPEHGLGFPLLLAIPYRVLGYAHLGWFLDALAIAAALILAGYCDGAFEVPWLGTAAGMLLLCLPVWQMYAPRVYPEVAAGTIALGLYALMTRRSMGRIAAMIIGLGLAFLPLLYGRFAIFALFLGLIALLRSGLRRDAMFWSLLGAGVALSIGLMLEVYGLHHWGIAAPSANQIQLTGSWERFWREWLDRGHGIGVAQPVLLLCFWAVPYLVRRAWSQAEFRASAALGLLVAAYALVFSLIPSGEGESAPGRYLSAATPLALVLILHWTMRKDRFRKVRWAGAFILSAASVWMILDGIFASTPSWKSLTAYQSWFPLGWTTASFVRLTGIRHGDSAPLGVALVALVCLSKSAAWWWERRPGHLPSTTISSALQGAPGRASSRRTRSQRRRTGSTE